MKETFWAPSSSRETNNWQSCMRRSNCPTPTWPRVRSITSRNKKSSTVYEQIWRTREISSWALRSKSGALTSWELKLVTRKKIFSINVRKLKLSKMNSKTRWTYTDGESCKPLIKTITKGFLKYKLYKGTHSYYHRRLIAKTEEVEAKENLIR